MRLLLVAMVVLGLSGICLAASEPVEGEVHASGAVESPSHPTPAAHPEWAARMVSVTVAMFLLAMLVGPVVRANMPQEMPVTHSHDEPAGGHGHGGATADAHSH